MVGPKLLTAEEVARLLRTDTKTIYALVDANGFPPGSVIRIGPLVRFKRRKILEAS